MNGRSLRVHPTKASNSFFKRAKPGRMDPEVKVRVLRTTQDIEELREVWESWPGCRDSHIDLFLTVLREPGVVRPHVIVIYHRDQPQAMLVGRIDRKPLDFRVGYIHVRPMADILYFVYGALRGNSSLDNSALFLDEIRRALVQGEADAAYLNFLRTESHLFRLAKTFSSFLTRDHASSYQSHFSVTLPRSAEEFYRSLSSTTRYNHKKKAAKLLADHKGLVNIRCYKDIAEVDRLIEDVETVARTSYQRGLGVGFAASQEIRERLLLKAQNGWLRCYVLYVEDRSRAFWIGDVNGSTFGSDYLGYDADFAKYSPGMYLVTKVIEGFCDGHEKGISEVDFAPGHSQYKQVLANHEWREEAVYIFAPTVKGMGLTLLRSVTGGLDQFVKKTLANTQLLQRIKKMWRTHARSKQIATA